MSLRTDLKDIKAVAFDLDGVLVDMVEGHFLALNKALKLFGYEITREMQEGEFDGLPTRIKLDKLTEKFGLPESLHPVIREIKQKYTDDYVEETVKPDYEKMLLLHRLQKDGILLACCSNATRHSVRDMLKRAKLLDYFQDVLSNEDVKNPKPDPEIYFKVLAWWEVQGITPQEVAIVEDNEYGKQAARASGGLLIPVIGVQDVKMSLFYD